MSFPGRGPAFWRLPIAPGFQSSYSWRPSGTISALVGTGTSPAGELPGLHEVPARARECESAGRPGSDWASCSALAHSCFCQSVRGNPDSNVASISCLAALEGGRQPGHQGPWSEGHQSPIPPARGLWLSVVVEGWLCVRYSGQAEFQVFLSFVYIRTDNYMADLLIARKINFSFKTCQLGH